jgi:hypothetical protein
MTENEKYGFVYIWRDKKHNRYYIGSHWGTENDGYICSSQWMKRSYDRRPKDFKRRIIKKTFNKNELLDLEFHYLNMIKECEIKIKYYNLRTHKPNHWNMYPENITSIKEKISLKTKEAMARPEVREKYLKGYAERNFIVTDEVKKKKSDSMKKTMAEKYPIEDRKKVLLKDSEELKELHRNNSKNLWANRTDEEKTIIGAKIAESNKGFKRRLGHTNTPEHRAKISAAQKGRKMSPEQYANYKKAMEKRKGIKPDPLSVIKRSVSIQKYWDSKRSISRDENFYDDLLQLKLRELQ